MTGPAQVSPAFVVALAMAVGIVAQSLARHLRLPGIVLLLAAGVLLGPDMTGLLDPNLLGPALHAIVGFAVAVILFEGGMNLNLARLRREAGVIRRLITVGAFVTAAGGALAARYVMNWDWRIAILFGTLVIVTGPTVVTPLLRRIRVKHTVETVLEAEGVLIDAIGAIVAVVALEVVVSPTGEGLANGVLNVLLRLGFGALAGLVGGLLIAGALRVTLLIPEGLENVFTLAMVLALYQASDHLLPESGIAAVTAAGLVVGNVRTKVTKDLREFKEQLTVLLIGVLFVLLAADVRIDEVRSLGSRGLITVVALMLVIRPLNVLASTVPSGLTWRERLFLCWLAPRGIVAAAVASLFAQTLHAREIPGGSELRALVFLLIATTVVIQGLSGGLVARALGLKRASRDGFVVLGANQLGIALGEELTTGGGNVIFMESNPEKSHAAEAAGFRVIFGNALQERSLLRAQLESRAGVIAVTHSEEINLLFARNVREHEKLLPIYVGLHRDHASVKPKMVHELGGKVLFGAPKFLELWSVRLERSQARKETWVWTGAQPEGEVAESTAVGGDSGGPGWQPDDNVLLPLVVIRGARIQLIDATVTPRKKDRVRFLVNTRRLPEAHAWFAAHGWLQVEEELGGEGAREPAPA